MSRSGRGIHYHGCRPFAFERAQACLSEPVRAYGSAKREICNHRLDPDRKAGGVDCKFVADNCTDQPSGPHLARGRKSGVAGTKDDRADDCILLAGGVRDHHRARRVDGKSMKGVLNPFLRAEGGAEAGLWLITERKLQQIADASAYSAAARHMSTQNLTVLEQAARASATASGMVADDEFALYLPPQSGGVVGESAYVQVAISREGPRYFSGLFAGTNAPVQISVRAVAGTDPDSGEPVCMLALSPSASPAFGVGGAGVVNVTECALSSNSSASN